MKLVEYRSEDQPRQQLAECHLMLDTISLDCTYRPDAVAVYHLWASTKDGRRNKNLREPTKPSDDEEIPL